MPLHVAHEAMPAARPVQFTVLAYKNIGLEIKTEKEEQEEQYEDVLEY